MKKIVAFVFGAFLLASVSYGQGQAAGITNVKDAKAAISDVSADRSLVYKGIEIFVPAGTKVDIADGDDDNTFYLEGTDMEGVKVGNKEISSQGNARVALDTSNNNMSVASGTITVAEGGNTNTYSEGSSVAIAPAAPAAAAQATEAAPAKSTNVFNNAFVAVTEDTTKQQASESAVLSPSAPGNI